MRAVYVDILGSYFQPFVKTFILNDDAISEHDNAPLHRLLFATEEHSSEFEILT